MRVLITGSSGQIGTNLGLALQSQGHTVFGVDKRANTWTNDIDTLIQDLGTPYRQFEGGIGDVTYPTDLDVVVHFAAYAKVHELVKYPDRALENTIMAWNVVEFCRRNQLPLILGSSREVYGNIKNDTAHIAEGLADFTLAASPYSASKLSGEAMIYAYAKCYGLRYLVFRFSNVYGRYDNDLERMERVIPLFIEKISRREPIIVYGESKILDFTYIDDCVSGVSSGIERLVSGQVTNQTINLACGQGNSLIKMTEYISEALGIEPEMTIEPSLVGEVTNYVADISKARALLDYAPQMSLRDGIFKTVAWSKAWAAR